MTGEHFFAGRRFVATRDLKGLRYPESSAAVADTSIGSFLALYWMERGHHREAEDWAVERVLWLGANGRMDGGGANLCPSDARDIIRNMIRDRSRAQLRIKGECN